jgi:hypothetical protein
VGGWWYDGEVDAAAVICPDQQEQATATVIEQAEVLSAAWTAA